MNAPTYSYSAENVDKLDGGLIDQSGGYVLTINWAKAVQSKSGGWGVEIQATSDDGLQLRNPVTLWTFTGDGRRIFGHDILDSLLICAGMKPGMAMKPGRVPVKVWDADLRHMVDEEADGYPGFTGKRVGMIIQREAYTKQNGDTGYRLNLIGAYHPDDMRSAGEIIGGKNAQATDRKIAGLRDKDSTGAPVIKQMPSKASGPSYDDLPNDDIPFISSSMHNDIESQVHNRMRRYGK
jgi:hypothetical protein